MSAEQYQRSVNSLETEIAKLEKKKAALDIKVAEEERKAAGVTWPKHASESTIKYKQEQIKSHTNAANKAKADSADLEKRIADKRGKLNDANVHLRKEQQAEEKKQYKAVKNMQQAYEARIAELKKQSLPVLQSKNDIPEADTEYDVFISHATEDKKDFVDELVTELKNNGLKVWYDTSEIKWGNSLRDKIDQGLRCSRYGIIVLSPSYIADDKYWTKAELNGLFQTEIVKKGRLLPIWHRLTMKDVMNFSPIIAGIRAMNTTTMTAKEMADEFAKLISGAQDS